MVNLSFLYFIILYFYEILESKMDQRVLMARQWSLGIMTVNRLYLSKYLIVPCDLNAPLLLKFTLLSFLEREKRETYIWMHIDLQIALIYTFYLLLAIAFDRFETYLIRYESFKCSYESKVGVSKWKLAYCLKMDVINYQLSARYILGVPYFGPSIFLTSITGWKIDYFKYAK